MLNVVGIKLIHLKFFQHLFFGNCKYTKSPRNCTRTQRKTIERYYYFFYTEYIKWNISASDKNFITDN